MIFVLDGAVTLDGLDEAADGVNNNAPLVTVNTGGVLIMSGAARITGNTNSPETGMAQGGGVKLAGASLVMRDNAKIDGCRALPQTAGQAAQGGGVHATAISSIELRGNASITGNRAQPSTGASLAQGGGAYAYESVFSMKDNAAVTGNFAGIAGGAYTGAVQGGGIYAAAGNQSLAAASLGITGSATVKDNRAIGGSGAASGGGIATAYCYITIKDNASVSNNTAQGGSGETVSGGAQGGGLYLSSSRADMSGGRVTGNRAQGGSRTGAYANGASIFGRGGGISATGAANATFTLNISGGEISGNTAAAGTIPAETAAPGRTATNAGDSAGGGIYSANPVHLSGGVIRDNTAGSAASPGNAQGGAVALNYVTATPFARLYLSGAAAIPANSAGVYGATDTRNTVAVQMGYNMGAGTTNHQNAPVLIEGAFAQPVVVDIVSLTPLRSNVASPVDQPNGLITGFAAGGARPLFWWASATVRPPLPGNITLGRFYEFENVSNASGLSADYYLYRSTDISQDYVIDGEGLLKAR